MATPWTSVKNECSAGLGVLHTRPRLIETPRLSFCSRTRSCSYRQGRVPDRPSLRDVRVLQLQDPRRETDEPSLEIPFNQATEFCVWLAFLPTCPPDPRAERQRPRILRAASIPPREFVRYSRFALHCIRCRARLGSHSLVSPPQTPVSVSDRTELCLRERNVGSYRTVPLIAHH